MLFAEVSLVEFGRRISEPTELREAERHVDVRLKNAVRFRRKPSRRSVFRKSETHRLHSHMQHDLRVSDFNFSEICERAKPRFLYVIVPVLLVVVHRVNIRRKNSRHSLRKLRQNRIVPAVCVLSVIGRPQMFGGRPARKHAHEKLAARIFRRKIGDSRRDFFKLGNRRLVGVIYTLYRRIKITVFINQPKAYVKIFIKKLLTLHFTKKEIYTKFIKIIEKNKYI